MLTYKLTNTLFQSFYACFASLYLLANEPGKPNACFAAACFSMRLIILYITVQPCISYIHKPASELSVAALQLMFTHFRNERLFYHKKVLNNTMNKLIVLPIIFLWLNCYYYITKKRLCIVFLTEKTYNDIRVGQYA